MMLFKTYADNEEVDRVRRVIERGSWWLNGEEVHEFERRVRDMVQDNINRARFTVSFNSGTSALYTLLIRSGITGEVILPSLTYPATANAVYGTAPTPVFADVERDSLGLDIHDVKEKITSRTRAIIPVHFGGSVCKDIEALRDLAIDEDIKLIEDAAQSFGATRDGTIAGGFGESAMFSFSFNKIVSTGAGGMIVTRDEDVSKRCRQYSKQGKTDDGVFSGFGLNFVMPSINAAIGLAQMNKLEHMIEERRARASYMNEQIKDIGVIEPAQEDHEGHVYQMYNILCEDEVYRDAISEFLSEKNIDTRISYPPVHYRPFYRDMLINSTTREWPELPVTEDVSRRILTLPFHLYLDYDDLDYIVNSIREFTEA